MRFLFTVLLVAPFLAACPNGTVVRDTNVYENEIGFVRSATSQSVGIINSFLAEFCECAGDPNHWEHPLCGEAATLSQVLDTRMPYHMDMMEYLGGIIEDRPPEEPPEIPGAEALCPADEASEPEPEAPAEEAAPEAAEPEATETEED